MARVPGTLLAYDVAPHRTGRAFLYLEPPVGFLAWILVALLAAVVFLLKLRAIPVRQLFTSTQRRGREQWLSGSRPRLV